MRRLSALFTALLFAGCATATVPTGPPSLPARADSDLAARPAPPCVPPGFRPVADWHLEGQESMMAPDTAGGQVMLVFRMVSGAQARGPALSVWIGQLLAWVDPSVSDYGVPVWYDTGVMTPQGEGEDAHLVAKTTRQRACDWKEFMVPRPSGHEENGYRLPPVTPNEERRI